MSGDYVYKNSGDTVRVRIMRRSQMGAESPGASREWDVDVWTRSPDGSHRCVTLGEERGDVFYSKAEARAAMVDRFGSLTSINPPERVTEGWECPEIFV